jgi:pimeloyl-ACP methyl ester carboxylesterase
MTGTGLRLDPPAGARTGRVLVFLPGFMTPAASYGALLEPLTAHGISVVVPQLYRRGPGALAGRATVEREAADAAEVVRGLAGGRSDRRVFLGGHSRGGQAAWRAANLLAGERLPAGLGLVDPVDGAGRAPAQPTATSARAAFTCPALVVGAGIGGRCAPEPVNHRAFARAAPHARHVVVTRLGHADVLDGRSRRLGRWLCGGAEDPDAGRAAVTALVASLVLGDDRVLPPGPGLVEWLAPWTSGPEGDVRDAVGE